MNLKDPTPPFLYSDQSFIHLYQGLNAFSLPVIYTQEEKNLKYQNAIVSISGRVHSASGLV